MVATMIAAAGASLGTALGVSAAFGTFVVSFALSMIVTRIFGQDQQGPQDSGTREQVPPSNVNAIPIVYGDAYLGGTFVDAVLSEDQTTMYYVLAVSCVSPNGQFFYDVTNFYYGDRLVTFQSGGSCISVKIKSGGTGYAVGNVLTIQGGSPTTAAQVTVTAVSSGVITAVSITTAGSYGFGSTPSNPAQVTGGSGTGASFILGYTSSGHAVQALTDEAGNVDKTIFGFLYINLYKSSDAGVITAFNCDAPNVVMGGSDIDPDLRWPSSGRQMNGLAFAIVKLYYSQEASTTSLSPITFYASHFLYGTGVAKPGHVWYDYITNAQYGGAIDPAFVDADSGIALNTYSDELITFETFTGTPATQARYRMNGVIDAGQTVLSNLDKIMTCCDSWMAYNAAKGQWSVVVNQPDSVSYAFDDDNIIGEIRVSATDITQSINIIEAKFPDKGSRDQANFVNIATPDILRYPNEPDNKYSVTYDMCNDSVQAQYLANRVLEQAREDLIVSFSTTYYGIQVDAGSVVSVTNSDYGWTNKLFRVVKVNEASLPDGSLGAKLEMSEYSAAVYDDFNVKQYKPVPNSGLSSVIYFSGLTAPIVVSSNPTSAIPNFNVSITIPAIGRVTKSELFYTTSATPTASDWQLLSTATSIDGQPVTPSTTYIFENQVLPTGASPTAVYYFSYVVSNENSTSARSPTSAAFTWSPVANTGPTGATGPSGPTGGAGGTGPRTAQIYFYYNTAQSTAPTAPTTAQVAYNFSTSTPSITTAGWSSLFNPSTLTTTTANNKYWAVRVIFQETTFGGAYTETISSVFTWQNMDGLVTFTNLATSVGPLGTNTTFIDGGTITTNTLNVNKIQNNTSGTFNTNVTFGLGTGTSIGGYLAGGAFTSTNISYAGLLAANTAAGDAFGAGTTSTNVNGSAISGVGYGNTGFTTYRTRGIVGNGESAGIFQTGGANTIQTAITAEIRLARYTGGVSYAYYIISGAAYPFTAGHDGLQLLTEALPEVGDIMVDVQLIAADSIENTITQMSPSSSANQVGAIGVFVGVSGAEFVPAALGMSVPDAQGALLDFVFKPEYANIYDTYRPIAVNAIGEGKINVCNQGGDIAIGDLLVCSDVLGKAMKQADDVFHSYTVAKARENVTFTGPSDIRQIACIYMGG